MRSYKVISMKDKWLSGKFDPAVLEATLNSYAKQGWRVVQSVTASVPGMLSANREEIIVIMERELEVSSGKAMPSGVEVRSSDSAGGSDVYKL